MPSIFLVGLGWRSWVGRVGLGKGYVTLVAHAAEAYPGVSSMKHAKKHCSSLRV